MAILIRTAKPLRPRKEGRGWGFESLLLLLKGRRPGIRTPQLFLMIVASASVMIPAGVQGQSNVPSEYQVKAAYIYNFAKFIEWPSPAAAGPNTPIGIGILGKDPFGQEIEGVINGKTASGRRLVIKRFSNLNELAPCHILFVSSSQSNNLKQIFAAVAGSGVLMVGETDQFAEAGGVIQFTMSEGRVHLIINQTAAERASLKISAKLLDLAHVIRK